MAADTLTPSFSLLLFASFVVHFTTVLFIAAIYGFAFKFLDDRSYIPIAIGWFLNAFYIGLEAVLMMVQLDRQSMVPLQLFTAGLGVLSTPFFYLSTCSRGPNDRRKIRISFSIGASLFATCIVAAWTLSRTSIPAHWVFVVVIFPAALYSAFVLISVAHKFFVQFPEEDYGKSSRILYGSWAAYGILQFFYPFKGFFENQRLIFALLFSIAFCIKVFSSGSLLSMLRESYATVQSEIREASVLADIGNVAAGLHHDIANPLVWIDAELSLLAQKRSGDEIVMHSIQKIRQPVGLIGSAIKFVSSIRADPEAVARAFKRISTTHPISLSISMFRKRNPNARLRVVAPSPDAPVYYVRANNDLLAEAFVNVLNNALEASARVLRIRVRRVFEDELKVQFIFTNDGRMLTDEERENCLKPGWSSKEKGANRANVGMGLYMCDKLVNIHRGSIRIENTSDGKSVEVTVSIPAARHVAEKEERRETADNE